MRDFLTQEAKISCVKAATTTSATGTLSGTALDMAANGGYEGVTLVTKYGTAAANNLLYAVGNNDNGSTWSAIAGSEIDLLSAEGQQIVDIHRCGFRYIKPLAQRGTASKLGDIWAFQYGPRTRPQSNDTKGTQVCKRVADVAGGTK